MTIIKTKNGEYINPFYKKTLTEVPEKTIAEIERKIEKEFRETIFVYSKKDRSYVAVSNPTFYGN